MSGFLGASFTPPPFASPGFALFAALFDRIAPLPLPPALHFQGKGIDRPAAASLFAMVGVLAAVTYGALLPQKDILILARDAIFLRCANDGRSGGQSQQQGSD